MTLSRRPFLVALLAVLNGPSAAADVVWVRGLSNGVGITVLAGGRCLVITPLHVVEKKGAEGDVVQAIDIRVRGTNTDELAASLDTRYEPDLAVLRLKQGDAGLCQDPDGWQVASLAADHLAGRECLLKTALRAGVVRGTEVRVTEASDRFLRFKAKDPSASLSMGMSGSPLYLEGRLAGVLLDVDTPTSTGRAITGRYLDDLLGTTIRPPVVVSPAPIIINTSAVWNIDPADRELIHFAESFLGLVDSDRSAEAYKRMVSPRTKMSFEFFQAQTHAVFRLNFGAPVERVLRQYVRPNNPLFVGADEHQLLILASGKGGKLTESLTIVREGKDAKVGFYSAVGEF